MYMQEKHRLTIYDNTIKKTPKNRNLISLYNTSVVFEPFMTNKSLHGIWKHHESTKQATHKMGQKKKKFLSPFFRSSDGL